MLDISVIVPLYNEEESLPELHAWIKRVMEANRFSYEIIFVNDGSTDRTVEVAREWGVQHIVSFKQNRGLARGFMAGIDACLHLGADIIVNTDADDQYRGEDIERLDA